MRNAIVLAAGKGTRMVSEHSKVMQKILGEPMIGHVVDHLEEAGAQRIVVVVGYQAEEIREYLGDRVEYAVQEPQMGSGHAVSMAASLKREKGKTLLVNGDSVLVQPETYRELYQEGEKEDLTIASVFMSDPSGYGRIVRSHSGRVQRIVEEKDATDNEKLIQEINCGIYCVENELLWEYLPEIQNENAQKEYYLTDLVEIFLRHGKKVGALRAHDPQEMAGVNDRVQLAEVTRWMQRRVNEKLMRAGVTMVDPSTVFIDKRAQIGMDTVIGPGVTMEGKIRIGKGCRITSGTYLRDVQIGDGCVIDSSEITDSSIGSGTTVGPYSHLRNGCAIGEKCRIGNFVELKNTSFGYNTKCAHLTYVGDSTVGSHVNFGCGVVTVNYDGKNKYRTTIDDGAFIGSNVNLIAPVHIGKKALCAAGSTITDDVKDGDMGIARSRQSIKEGYGDTYLNK